MKPKTILSRIGTAFAFTTVLAWAAMILFFAGKAVLSAGD